MRIALRRGQAGDPGVTAEVWLRARKAAIGAIPEPVHDDDDVRAWFGSHVVRNCELWVAHDDSGRVVGIMVLDGDCVDQL